MIEADAKDNEDERGFGPQQAPLPRPACSGLEQVELDETASGLFRRTGAFVPRPPRLHMRAFFRDWLHVSVSAQTDETTLANVQNERLRMQAR
jgi:hypothetical protein